MARKMSELKKKKKVRSKYDVLIVFYWSYYLHNQPEKNFSFTSWGNISFV